MLQKAKIIREVAVAVFAVVTFFATFFVEDQLVVYLCFGVATITALLFCYWFPEASRKARSIAATCIIASFIVIGAYFRHVHLEKQRENVRDNLRFSATIHDDNLRNSEVTVKNGGSTAIHFRFICHITMLVPVGGRGFIRNSFIASHERSGTLGAGSDAQADDCLSDVSVPSAQITCVDVQVRLFYSLETQPDVEDEQEHGFIAERRGSDFQWADRAAKQEKSDCERFVAQKYVSPNEQLKQLSDEILRGTERIESTSGLNPDKKEGAQMVRRILEFGESIKDSRPGEPDLEKDGMMAVMKFQQVLRAWSQKYAPIFHAKFDQKIEKTANLVRKTGTNPDHNLLPCRMISESYPPFVIQTERCAATMWELVQRIPDH